MNAIDAFREAVVQQDRTEYSHVTVNPALGFGLRNTWEMYIHTIYGYRVHEDEALQANEVLFWSPDKALSRKITLQYTRSLHPPQGARLG